MKTPAQTDWLKKCQEFKNAAGALLIACEALTHEERDDLSIGYPFVESYEDTAYKIAEWFHQMNESWK